MPRKIIDGPVRNKERTKERVISAVGHILKKNGFAGLNISKVALRAKVDRRLIYDYFGGLEGVVKEYLNANDYWKIDPENLHDILENNRIDHGKSLSCAVLEDQLHSLMANEEMRRIISWGLSEKLPELKELDLKRENAGEAVFKEIIDPYFAGSPTNFRAVYALLMGGVYYLTLHAGVQENPFCGIDLQKPEGMEAIKNAMKQLIDAAYSGGPSDDRN